ncbi:MAG: TlyA family RNA methyltransferase [Actinomycetota bacterium]|nr:TlyA family RNA methyltransferase [Actinomycetota bacterium]
MGATRNEPEYVSRGGKKLERALDEFGLDIKGKKVLDVGSSTGGFTECFLRRGAEMVIALDVGKGLLDWRLRNDPRVVVKEGINARYLEPSDLPFTPLIAAIDVSFISLRKVLEPVFCAIEKKGKVVALVKPQFEAERKMVEKGGVVRNEETHLAVLNEIIGWASSRSLKIGGITYSPLKGPKGNIEFFLLLAREGKNIVDIPLVEQTVKEAHCFYRG